MIGKIFKYIDYYGLNVYYRLLKFNMESDSVQGKIIKSKSVHHIIGKEYSFYLDLSKEISEQDFNKIMVFE